MTFQGIVAPKKAGVSDHPARALSLFKQAEALGGTLCAWSAESFSFSFDVDDVEEAITLALNASHEIVPEEERFGVGIKQGDLAPLGESTSPFWGPALVGAGALARAAYPGEVLLDPELPALRAGDLLITGSRLSAENGFRVRGSRLDPVEPFRREAMANVARLAEPPLIGCDGVFEQLRVPHGAMGVVRADRGAGGSRLLAEWTDRLSPWRVLLITPVGAGREPLGAARNALSRSLALYGAPPLPSKLRGVLDRVLAGEGADLWSVAELLDAWLGSAEDRSGVLAVDDAGDIDTPTLEAVASAVSVRGRFRMLLRLEAQGPMPDAFAAIPMGPALVIGPLARENAERLAAAFTGGALSEDALVRWTRRGKVSPLALREAIAEGITSGDLCWAGEVAVPRRRIAGRGRSAGAHEWIARRVRRAPAELRALLTGLAILGGDASDAMLDDITAAQIGSSARVSQWENAVLSEGWAVRPEPGWLKLKSRTAVDALVGVLDPATRRAWHATAASTIEQHGGLLSRADAAFHAAQAGNAARAAALALATSQVAATAGLELASSTLFAFAKAQDPEIVMRLRGGAADATPIVPISIADEPTVSADQPPEFLAIDLEPSDLISATTFDRGVDSTRSAHEPADSMLMTSESPALSRAGLEEATKEALLAGDLQTVEALLGELGASGHRTAMVERLSALIALGRGGQTDSLRRLALAADAPVSPEKKARAQLAFAVALASADDAHQALLMALTALASARQAEDVTGEQACMRFLAKLSASAGHELAAATWLRQTTRAGRTPSRPALR